MTAPTKAFAVWDEMNSEEDYATRIETTDPEHAAIMYAEDDGSGWADGLYHDCEHPIAVRCPDGTLVVFQVEAEMVPSFRASVRDEVKP